MSKVLSGKVVSTKMAKTVVVAVQSKRKHPLYKKIITKTKKYKADVSNLEVREGDLVKIIETKPISKGKRWKLIEKAERK